MGGGGRYHSEPNEASGKDYSLRICGIDTLGAPILLSECGGLLNHVDTTSIQKNSIPRVEVCAHGIRVGCTFVTVDALRRLAKEMEDFKRCNTKVIQP